MDYSLFGLLLIVEATREGNEEEGGGGGSCGDRAKRVYVGTLGGGKYEASHSDSVILRAMAAMLKYGLFCWLAMPANIPRTPSLVSQKSKSLLLMSPSACACPVAVESACIGRCREGD